MMKKSCKVRVWLWLNQTRGQRVTVLGTKDENKTKSEKSQGLEMSKHPINVEARSSFLPILYS